MECTQGRACGPRPAAPVISDPKISYHCHRSYRVGSSAITTSAVADSARLPARMQTGS